MRVLMQTRPGLGTNMTGDVTQVRSTAAALERMGASVRFSDSLEPDVTGIDIVHLFSTLVPHYTYLRLRYLKRKKVPVAVSTIYWEWEPGEFRRESILRLGVPGYAASKLWSEVRRRLPNGIRYRLEKPAFPYALQSRFYDEEKRIGLRNMRAFIYENADVLLPNSHREYEYLADRFGIMNDYVAVPNAVDPSFAAGNAGAFHAKYGVRDFILCSAVVQGRKNQIRLVRAARDLGVPLVLVGSEEPVYGKRCREEASSNVHFLGELRGEDLRNAYAAARVHALASFYETPGLSSLEAAVADTVLVVSDRGCTREYFGDFAHYCDPNSERSIREALRKALDAKPDAHLKETVFREYNWGRTAERTMEGYRRAVLKAGV